MAEGVPTSRPIDLTLAMVELSVLRSDIISDRLSKLHLIERVDTIMHILRESVSETSPSELQASADDRSL